ncbi:hypothetical protein Tco_0503802 [Tanacetum coccineum]
MTSRCFNNIKVNLFLKHGLVSRTYSKKSLIMASIFSSKSKSFMIMSIPLQSEPSISRPMAISLPQDVPSTSERLLIELENQFQRLMEAHLDPKSFVQVNKITSPCEIRSGSHDTQYCMENPEQAFVDYASSRTDEAGGLVSNFMASQDARLSKFEADFKQQQDKMTNKMNTVLNAINDRMTGALPSDTYDDSSEEKLGKDESAVTRELEVGNPIIVGGSPSNIKIPCNIGHVHVEKAYIDLNSSLNVMTRMQYNWIMRKQLEPREDPEGIREISNFTGRIKGIHIFIGIFTYISDFMIVEDISSIIDHRLSQVVLGKPFVEISNMTHDLSLGVVKFTDGTNEIAYKMPHKIEQYSSLSDLEKEHTKLVYLRNEEDKRRRVVYVMNKILEFYKECLKLRPEYLTGLEDEGEVT